MSVFLRRARRVPRTTGRLSSPELPRISASAARSSNRRRAFRGAELRRWLSRARRCSARARSAASARRPASWRHRTRLASGAPRRGPPGARGGSPGSPPAAFTGDPLASGGPSGTVSSDSGTSPAGRPRRATGSGVGSRGTVVVVVRRRPGGAWSAAPGRRRVVVVGSSCAAAGRVMTSTASAAARARLAARRMVWFIGTVPGPLKRSGVAGAGAPTIARRDGCSRTVGLPPDENSLVRPVARPCRRWSCAPRRGPARLRDPGPGLGILEDRLRLRGGIVAAGPPSSGRRSALLCTRRPLAPSGQRLSPPRRWDRCGRGRCRRSTWWSPPASGRSAEVGRRSRGRRRRRHRRRFDRSPCR